MGKNPWKRSEKANEVRSKYANNSDWSSEAKAEREGHSIPERKKTKSPPEKTEKSCFPWVNFIVRLFTMASAVILGYSAVENIKLTKQVIDRKDAIFHGGVTFEEHGRQMILFHSYYVAFSVLVFLAEFRFNWLKRTLLKPFRFVHGYVGRGLFYIIIGLPYLVIFEWLSCVPGSLLVASGCTQIIMTMVFRQQVRKEHHIDEETRKTNDNGKGDQLPLKKDSFPGKHKSQVDDDAVAVPVSTPENNPWSKNNKGNISAEARIDEKQSAAADGSHVNNLEIAENDPNDPDYNPWANK